VVEDIIDCDFILAPCFSFCFISRRWIILRVKMGEMGNRGVLFLFLLLVFLFLLLLLSLRRRRRRLGSSMRGVVFRGSNGGDWRVGERGEVGTTMGGLSQRKGGE
jgi:hypothetical protein